MVIRDEQWLQEKMEFLWKPRHLAMIGATNNFGKWGFFILARLLDEGYLGEIYPINPREERVLGRKAYRSIGEVPGPVDLAIIVTPAPTVPAVIRECAAKKVPAVVVITSDFSETGPEGARLEREIVGLARAGDMILVGPNTMGIYSAEVKLKCLMAPIAPLPGKTACISQSGNVGTHMLFQGRGRGLGFGKFMSSGNEGDLTFEDYLCYFGQDHETSAIVGYLEGLDPPTRFLEIARAVTRKKPVIVYKGGRSQAGSKAAASHTGALAGDARVFRAAMRQAGVIVAESNKEVIELARALELQPAPKGPRIGILTRGGGWGVITSDACSEAGLCVSPLAGPTIAALDKLLPSYWSRGNPVDMVATIDNKAYIDCLQVLAADPNVDAVLALGANIGAQLDTALQALANIGVMSKERIRELEEEYNAEAKRFSAELKGFLAGTEKPALTVGRWVETPEWEQGIMMIPEPEEAARMMAKMVEYGRFLNSPMAD